MTLVVASSTASARRSAVPSVNPADSAIFFVTSRTRPRNDVWLGMEIIRLGLGARTASGARLFGAAEAGDGLDLRGIDAIQVVEAQHLEDVPDGLVQVGQPQVPAIAADLLDRPHDGPQAGAGDVGQAPTVHYDLEPPLGQRFLDLTLEDPDGVGVDEALRVEECHPFHVASLDGQLGHESPNIARQGVLSTPRASMMSLRIWATRASASGNVRSSRRRSSNSSRSVRP